MDIIVWILMFIVHKVLHHHNTQHAKGCQSTDVYQF